MKRVDYRDRQEYPYPEHIQNPSTKTTLCGSTAKKPIFIEIDRDNDPSAICSNCRRKLASLAKYDWQTFLFTIGKD